ncbi:MAG: glycosyltransferase family 4 protein [Thiothrix sp.]|nr:glycosyltransferase family 4 protein [Thiothrix sp.]HPQ95395.1 glycosyltransferase family 4 protein [Thiolinea sp.]
MKIVFIAIKGIDVIGGIETYTVELGKKLASSGHDVLVYCMKTPQFSQPFQYEGIHFMPLPAIRSKYFAKISIVILASLHQLKLKDIDVVHYHAVGPSFFSWIPRLFGRYTVFQSHGHEWERSSWNLFARIFFRMAEFMTFRFVNDSMAVSKNLKSYYEKKYHKSVTYIPSGINPRQPLAISAIARHGVKNQEYFLYVGRLSREKRIEDLIRAYLLLGNPGIKLVIVGKERPEDIPYTTELRKLADGNSNILFPGPAYNDELVEWYSNAKAYILPSRIEGLPITLLEAMSFSRCCIASDIQANQEALDGKGLLYPLGDHAALQQQLEFVLNNPEQASQIGMHLKQHAYENYTWSHISDEFVKFYAKKNFLSA